MYREPIFRDATSNETFHLLLSPSANSLFLGQHSQTESYRARY